MVTALTQDDRAVLQHVARYRLTTPAILAATDLLATTEPTTAEGALRRLTAEEWLSVADLVPENPADGRVCFQLTPRAAERLGHTAMIAEPLSRNARIEWFAIATFCGGGDRFRQLFTKQEFQEKFRHLWFPGQPVRYYLEQVDNGPARLAFLRVDHDSAGRWDRLIDSCARFARQRTDVARVAEEHRPQVAEFAQLVERGQFQFTVLTALPEKRRAIELELERRTAARESVPPIQVFVVPELFDVLFPTLRG